VNRDNLELPVHTLGIRPLRVIVQRFDQHHPTRTKGAHRHAFFELMFLEQGGGTHYFGGRGIDTKDGDLYLIAPGEVHDVSALTTACGWLVVFEASAIGLTSAPAAVNLPGELLLMSFLRPLGTQFGHFSIPKKHHTFWLERIVALQDELLHKRLGYVEAASWYLKLMLLEAARLAATELQDVSLHKQPLLTKVFAFIEGHFRESISLTDVARAVKRSRSHLTALVRSETGRTVLEWINERRLTEARRLLLDTYWSVERIAHEVGFTDAIYFTRRWRKATGTTPSQWRQTYRAHATKKGLRQTDKSS
jgi:AraC-like DNA-binding protein